MRFESAVNKFKTAQFESATKRFKSKKFESATKKFKGKKIERINKKSDKPKINKLTTRTKKLLNYLSSQEPGMTNVPFYQYEPENMKVPKHTYRKLRDKIMMIPYEFWSDSTSNSKRYFLKIDQFLVL